MSGKPGAPEFAESDIRPVVRTAGERNTGVWIFGALLIIAGLWIFSALDARRQELASPALPAGNGEAGRIAAPPPLALPPYYLEPDVQGPFRIVPASRLPAITRAVAPAPEVVTRIVERPVPAAAPPPAMAQGVAQSLPSPVVIERPALAPPSTAGGTASRLDRVLASRLQNPSLTVPQGTIIAAVLETALDSTRPGAVRALVSRDVRSFDGSRVLIPRGSRLYGEYSSELEAGQKRALINWQRLTRPDAVIINLDSPAADPLGRAGVAGKVDSNFLSRFGGAILQSILDIGVGLATRSVADGTVIVGLPGSTQVTGQQQQQRDVQRTLRVAQGSSVSVFVARDLDFSTVER